MAEIDKANGESALREMIAERAYELWETQGRPEGCDLIHWYQAEQEILAYVVQGQLGGEDAQRAAPHPAPSKV
jgi:hypothetical protein